MRTEFILTTGLWERNNYNLSASNGHLVRLYFSESL